MIFVQNRPPDRFLGSNHENVGLVALPPENSCYARSVSSSRVGEFSDRLLADGERRLRSNQMASHVL